MAVKPANGRVQARPLSSQAALTGPVAAAACQCVRQGGLLSAGRFRLPGCCSASLAPRIAWCGLLAAFAYRDGNLIIQQIERLLKALYFGSMVDIQQAIQLSTIEVHFSRQLYLAYAAANNGVV